MMVMMVDDLRFLVELANSYTDVLLVVGNNDIGTLDDHTIVHNFRQFVTNLMPGIDVSILGFLPRKDHGNEVNPFTGQDENPVTRLNVRLDQEFPALYVSPRDYFRKQDFNDSDPAHLTENGYKHMAKLVYHVCLNMQ